MEIQEYIGKYLGPHQIEELVEQEVKTPLGKSVYEVKFKQTFAEDGRETTPAPELYTEKMLAVATSDESTDLTSLRDKRMKNVVSDILYVLAEYNIRYSEFEYMSGLLTASNNDNMGKAAEKMFGTDEYHRTLMHVERVLKQGEKNGEQSKDNSGGDGEQFEE